jgi:hypothetical protein
MCRPHWYQLVGTFLDKISTLCNNVHSARIEGHQLVEANPEIRKNARNIVVTGISGGLFL